MSLVSLCEVAYSWTLSKETDLGVPLWWSLTFFYLSRNSWGIISRLTRDCPWCDKNWALSRAPLDLPHTNEQNISFQFWSVLNPIVLQALNSTDRLQWSSETLVRRWNYARHMYERVLHCTTLQNLMYLSEIVVT